MAVFTELSDEDRNAITAAYDIQALSSVIGIADGDRETTYLFRSPAQELIVTLFENGAEPSDLERAFETMETLSKHGVPCPKPLRTVQGRATFEAADRLVAIVSFVSGSPSWSANPAKCKSLGRTMGQIHAILEPKETKPRGPLPTGVIHGALVPDNVFFIGDDVSGVINFRLQHDDVLIAEIADVLVGWTADVGGYLDRGRARPLLDGYNNIRSLTNAEREALPAFVMAAAARRCGLDNARYLLPGMALRAYQSILEIGGFEFDRSMAQ